MHWCISQSNKMKLLSNKKEKYILDKNEKER